VFSISTEGKTRADEDEDGRPRKHKLRTNEAAMGTHAAPQAEEGGKGSRELQRKGTERAQTAQTQAHEERSSEQGRGDIIAHATLFVNTG
jgi:hypothetical protein